MGTLLAALLCWLDARSREGNLVLRLEDLDPHRSKSHWNDEMVNALEWLGLDWDLLELQSAVRSRYAAAIESLSNRGLVYPCSCSRQDILGRVPHFSGAMVPYDGSCRSRKLPRSGWEGCREPLRVRCDEAQTILGGIGKNVSHDPWMGDPLIRRRDGAFSYHLASVVDDAAVSVTRVVRGRDLATSTPIQNVLQNLLDLPRPVYRHHFLLLERHGTKMAKLHGSLSWSQLRDSLHPEQLTGQLAGLLGLEECSSAVSPADLLESFSWEAIGQVDVVVSWLPPRLSFEPVQ